MYIHITVCEFVCEIGCLKMCARVRDNINKYIGTS